MGETQAITGKVTAGEGRYAMSAVAARQRGSLLVYYFFQLCFVIGGGIIGFVVGRVINIISYTQLVDPTLLLCGGLVVGAITYVVWCRQFILRRFKKRMTDRGMNTHFDQTLTLNEETIEMNSGSVSATAPWTAVTEIFNAKGYWIFMVGMNPWFAPKRFFANETVEVAFIRAALAHLTDSARDRSKSAVSFVTRSPWPSKSR